MYIAQAVLSAWRIQITVHTDPMHEKALFTGSCAVTGNQRDRIVFFADVRFAVVYRIDQRRSDIGPVLFPGLTGPIHLGIRRI